MFWVSFENGRPFQIKRAWKQTRVCLWCWIAEKCKVCSQINTKAHLEKTGQDSVGVQNFSYRWGNGIKCCGEIQFDCFLASIHMKMAWNTTPSVRMMIETTFKLHNVDRGFDSPLSDLASCFWMFVSVDCWSSRRLLILSRASFNRLEADLFM